MTFKNFILFESNEDNSSYPLSILTEKDNQGIDIEKLIKNTDKERLRKAIQEVKTRPPLVSEYNDGTTKLEYNFKSYPSVEMKRHKGFIIHKENKILRLYCDCKDFFYRLWTPLVEAGLARYDLPLKYHNNLSTSHNHNWTVETNNTGKIYICKHLAAMRDYI